MTKNQCSSCSWGSSHGASSSRGMVGSEICYCGELAILRVAKTPKNQGKHFWGCPNYRRSRYEEVRGCNFFKWHIEDNGDERDTTIGWQRRKIINLERSLLVYQKREKVAGVVYLLGVAVDLIEGS
ncbi:uncharacterized protein LOC106763353 [Vigna radiata var. radiata]|uniref:Uncharacterized protein LOC106763353 n=1 Tax=Vigna radiata var. radiata TaxID=3916 RepID=A0A1S3UAI2_VIGRR|nr:uncharacterized protein LOC106763353 [Vigna radiata var. radiata]